jgi:hypothetical protein
VIDYLERPAVLRPNPLNAIQHAVSFASYLIRHRTTYGVSGAGIGRFSIWAGRKLWLRPLRRRSPGYGAYFLCTKAEPLDHLALNRALYTAEAP